MAYDVNFSFLNVADTKLELRIENLGEFRNERFRIESFELNHPDDKVATFMYFHLIRLSDQQPVLIAQYIFRDDTLSPEENGAKTLMFVGSLATASGYGNFVEFLNALAEGAKPEINLTQAYNKDKSFLNWRASPAL